MSSGSNVFAPYKPQLAVDVTGASVFEVREDGSHSATVSPMASQTPHVPTNIFVAGLPTEWGEEELRQRYAEFGEVSSVKVVKSRHFGFVMFKKPECAHAAINATHLTRPVPSSTNVLHVSVAMHDEGVDDCPNERIFVRNLPQWATKEHLARRFAAFGLVVESAVLTNPMGQCKGSGFVQFATVEQAAKAVSAAASERLKLDDWDQPLEVKFSETPEVRQQRQERNRNRHKNWSTSPKYRTGAALSSSTGVSPMVTSPVPVYAAPPSQGGVLPSPQMFPPMMGGVSFPMMFAANSPMPPAAPSPTKIIYPSPPGVPVYSSPPVIVVNRVPLPQKGDLHFSGGPLTEEIVRMLLQPFGMIEDVKLVDSNETAFAARLSNTNQHAFVVQQLNGTLFSNGQSLAAGIYA